MDEVIEKIAAIPPAVLEHYDWIPIRRYLEMYGEDKEAVRKRIASGKWNGVWSRPEGAGIWISLKGLNAWASRHMPSGSSTETTEE